MTLHMSPLIPLKFMIDPVALKRRCYVPDPVKAIIIDPEAIFLTGILGESGRKMVKAGLPFYFTKPLANKLIKLGIAKQASNSRRTKQVRSTYNTVIDTPG